MFVIRWWKFFFKLISAGAQSFHRFLFCSAEQHRSADDAVDNV